MKTKILEFLQITPHQYEMIVIGNYIKWTKKFEKNTTDSQRLLTSPALFNWWYLEYTKLEQRFIELAEPYKNHANPCVFTDLYNETILPIHNLFSKPLVYTALNKRQVITANHNHN